MDNSNKILADDYSEFKNPSNNKISPISIEKDIDPNGDVIGYMSINGNIDYMGYKVASTATAFINLVPSGAYDMDSYHYIRDAILNGSFIAPPTLFVDWIASEKVWLINSHEGRHRCMAIKQLVGKLFTNDDIYVDIIPNKMRHSDITEEMLKSPFISQNDSKFMYSMFLSKSDYDKEELNKWIKLADKAILTPFNN
jgi:hypothetical protein